MAPEHPLQSLGALLEGQVLVNHVEDVEHLAVGTARDLAVVGHPGREAVQTLDDVGGNGDLDPTAVEATDRAVLGDLD